MQGVLCGMVGGMPGNLVMSFSVTSHTLGVRTKQFSILLAVLSGLMFIFGDYVVAVLPKMVPACVLFWLGIVLLVFWVYDGVGNVSIAEHAVVILMIFVDIILGAGPMIL